MEGSCVGFCFQDRILIDAQKRAAPEELCTEVFEYIEKNRPVGADVYVNPAEELEIALSLKLITSDPQKDYTELINTALPCGLSRSRWGRCR